MLNLFDQKTYPKSTLSLSGRLAKILASPGYGQVCKVIDRPLSAKQLDSSMNVDHVFLSGKMLKERSAQTVAQTFGELSKPLSTLGAIDLNGNCLIHAGFKSPRTGNDSILSEYLEKNVDSKYFLSERQIKSMEQWKAHENPLDNIVNA